MKRRIQACLLLLCAWVFSSPLSFAQSYPSRPITLVLPYAAGSGLDAVARSLANVLGANLGQTVIVENRPGAGTNLGAVHVARSKPDGYTLLLGSNATMAANKSLYHHLDFDPQTDFAPVAFLGKGSMVVVATPASGVTTFADLLKAAKADGGKTNIGAADTTARVWIALIKSVSGIQAETINYAAAPTMINNMLGGQLNFAVANPGTSRPFIKDKKLIPLAVTSKTRGKYDPNVPTLTELGYGQFELDPWYGIFAPKETPADVIQKLNTAINAALNNEDYARTADFVEVGNGGGTPQALGAFQAEEIRKWKGMVDRTGIYLD